MILRTAWLWGLLVIAFGVAVFVVSHRVDDQLATLRAIDSRIVDTRERIHLLEVEWASLNDPGRLARLARTHLAMAPASVAHQVAVVDLPAADSLPLARWFVATPAPRTDLVAIAGGLR